MSILANSCKSNGAHAPDRQRRASPTVGSQSHTAQFQLLRIYYPFHSRSGEGVEARARGRAGAEWYYTIEQRDGSCINLPAWMLDPAATNMVVVKRARIELKALRGVRELLDELLSLEALSTRCKEQTDGRVTRATTDGVVRSCAHRERIDRTGETTSVDRGFVRSAAREVVWGAAREGQALLAGALRCGHCGRKLQVVYRTGRVNGHRYRCRVENKYAETPVCEVGFGGHRVDEAISEVVLEALQPLGVEAALRAIEQAKVREVRTHRHLELAVEQARYEAQRAQRQYELAEPENRMVARELERRWNEQLEQLAQS